MVIIDKEKCIGCGMCVMDCQTRDIQLKDSKASVLNNVCLKCGHCAAICPVNAVVLDDYDEKEIIDYDNDTFKNNPENFLNAIKFRRTIRHFKNTPVEKEKLEKIIEAGRFTPTGGNRQPISYIVVQNKIRELTELALEALYEIACHQDFSADKKDPSGQKRRYAAMWKNMYRQYHEGNVDRLFFNTPAMIIVLGDKDASVSPEVDGGLAAANMQTMADALGLGVCFNGFFTIAAADKRIREFLNIPDNKKVIVSMLLGYTNNKYYRTVPRKKPEIKWI